MTELCPAAEKLTDSLPCPALIIGNGVALCGLVLTPLPLRPEPLRDIHNQLGIGCGCSMPDDDTTEEEINAHDMLSWMRVYGPNVAGELPTPAEKKETSK